MRRERKGIKGKVNTVIGYSEVENEERRNGRRSIEEGKERGGTERRGEERDEDKEKGDKGKSKYGQGLLGGGRQIEEGEKEC